MSGRSSHEIQRVGALDRVGGAPHAGVVRIATETRRYGETATERRRHREIASEAQRHRDKTKSLCLRVSGRFSLCLCGLTRDEHKKKDESLCLCASVSLWQFSLCLCGWRATSTETRRNLCASVSLWRFFLCLFGVTRDEHRDQEES